MKIFRPLLIPAACFIVTWGVTFYLSKHRNAPPVEEPPVSHHRASRPSPGTDEPRRLTVAQVEEQFQTRPTGEWAGIWQDFARTATVRDLESITPKHVDKEAWVRVRRDMRNVTYLLATEELAVRAARPVADEPGAYAAFAEANPEAVWKNLERRNLEPLSIGVMRTLAWRDPAGTLERFSTMPAPVHASCGSDEGGMKSGSPLGAILSSWSRRDPSAAAGAVMKLAPSERLKVAGGVAEVWACRDAPSAIGFITDFLDPGAENHYELRLESILRIGLNRNPAGTAKVIAANPELRRVMTNTDFTRVLRLWQLADPETAMAWAMETDEEGANHAEMLFHSIKHEPEEARRFIRKQAAIDPESAATFLRSLHAINPEGSETLAAELALPLPEGRASESVTPYGDDPAAACDLWLAELRRHQDPREALDALGWGRFPLVSLAERAVRFFPEKAAALAKLVPASSFGAIYPPHLRFGNRVVGNLQRYWPDLEVLTEPVRSTDPTSPGSRIFQKEFEIDPAAAAGRLLDKPVSTDDAVGVIRLWAPYDPAASQVWLTRLPEGEARKMAELELLSIQGGSDPVKVLEFLATANLPVQKTRQIKTSCLIRLAQTGGDWKSWLERLPGTSYDQLFQGDFDKETKVLDMLRRNAK
ncbi:hypothetical protein JIN84_06820 [Luteolibacter yonseiensis]|uniref:Uncharacterized protein n=1 Tax=Luteolibacter yonseiensis TaxID=1144680 RepID=A0A934V9M9_9BACT|nr:hypothetical protein [Luteolibacter yonseiensis]MBK1815318.1 hypothetical protein [Luteolibacter yonseiensis]